MLNTKKALPFWRRRLDATAKRLGCSRDGNTALEFALIAGPFFFLIFGLIEISILFLFSTTLDYGLSEIGREIRTGQLQTSGGSTYGELKQRICGNLFGLMDCDEKLQLDVSVFSSFIGSGDAASPLDEEGEWAFDEEDIEDTPLAVGAPNDIVMVRVFYDYQLITPVLSAGLENKGNGTRLLTSTLVFRNEPF